MSADIFADRLITQSGLEWHAPDQNFAQRIMRHVIECTVIHPMGSFGVSNTIIRFVSIY